MYIIIKLNVSMKKLRTNIRNKISNNKKCITNVCKHTRIKKLLDGSVLNEI